MTDMIADQQQQKVAGVRFTKVGKLYHFDFSQYPDLQTGDYVIVETARGRHMGQIMGFVLAEQDKSYRSILRPATSRDMVLRQQWEAKQQEALDLCMEQAQRMGGYRDVKFVAALYNYDGSVLTFLYSAEQKVNIGNLWNSLSRVFSAQVEMRQIGPRDVAKLLGGYGACGELRCCSTFLTDFSPISIKMAKMQGISLNPSEITGMCGRLRCCLVYEYEQYVEARKQLPRRNKKVGTPMGPGKVIDVQPLQDSVTVYIEGEGVRVFHREDLIPLEELAALEKKAKEPCAKHGGEPCDCGQKPGERNQDKINAQAAQPQAEAATPQEAAEPEKPPRKPRKPRRRPKNTDSSAGDNTGGASRSTGEAGPSGPDGEGQKRRRPRRRGGRKGGGKPGNNPNKAD